MSEHELPKSGDCLFQGAEDWHYNACVDFKFHHSGKEHAYISGYKLAGDALCEKVVQDRHVVDLVVYPMVYNYRHYVELSLKSTLHWGSAVMEQNVDSKLNHNLVALWSKVRPLLEKRWPNEDMVVLDNVEALILELAAVDPRSTAFRYYFHEPSQKHPAVTPETESVTHINIRNLYEVMGRLSNFFDGVSTQFQVDWDNLCESRQIEDELQSEYEAEWQAIMAEDYLGCQEDNYA